MKRQTWTMTLAVAVIALPQLPASATGLDPLSEACALMLRKDAELAAVRAETGLIADRPRWTTDARVAVNTADTLERAAGFDAGITFRIPLFSRNREIEAARALQRQSQLEQTIVEACTTTARNLVRLNAELSAAREAVEYHGDRLKYQKQAVGDGLEDESSLWNVAGAAREAERKAQLADQEWQVRLETWSRQYGADEWKKLRDLWVAYVKQRTP